MSWDLKCTITVDENEIKELADGLGNKYTTTIGELCKENNELMGKNDILESRLHASESLERLYKNRIETLLSENKQLEKANAELMDKNYWLHEQVSFLKSRTSS
jgi:predicted nuclease with TOPRIM domain